MLFWWGGSREIQQRNPIMPDIKLFYVDDEEDIRSKI